MGDTLVIIPTYDERENVESVVARVLTATPASVHVLVVDDASPDGTGDVADRLAATEARVQVLHRPAKQGLGPAYMAGFAWAMEGRYANVVEMDADGSHLPEHLPRLLAELGDHDVVIGSRWVLGGEVQNWPVHRLALSRFGNWYARALLGMPTLDATGGYRAFRLEALRSLALQEVSSRGYCFQVDLLLRAHDAGLRVTEVPIVFVERSRGRSKMSSRIVVEALLRVTQWGLQRRLQAAAAAVRGRGLVPAAVTDATARSRPVVPGRG